MSHYNFCFVFGPGCCGFNLFISLLDNHEEVVAIPFTMKLYKIFNKEKYNINFNELIEIIEKKTRFKYLKDGDIDPSLSIKEDCSLYDHSIFREELKKLTADQNIITRKKLIENIFIAYALAIKKDLKKLKYIIIDATYRDYLDKINYDFKEYKSFFLLRDPREQLLSLLKLHHKINYSLHVNRNYITHSIFSQEENYKLLEKIQNNDKYLNFLIKFENLKRKPTETIKKAVEFLNISFNDKLTKPTLYGNLKIFETSFSSKPISGMGEDNTSRLDKHLNKYQVIQSELLFSDYITKFNYPLKSYKINFLTKLLAFIHPFKFEILPSLDVLKKNHNKKNFKNSYFFKSLHFLYLWLINLYYYFINRFINLSYLKLFLKL